MKRNGAYRQKIREVLGNLKSWLHKTRKRQNAVGLKTDTKLNGNAERKSEKCGR